MKNININDWVFWGGRMTGSAYYDVWLLDIIKEFIGYNLTYKWNHNHCRYRFRAYDSNDNNLLHFLSEFMQSSFIPEGNVALNDLVTSGFSLHNLTTHSGAFTGSSLAARVPRLFLCTGSLTKCRRTGKPGAVNPDTVISCDFGGSERQQEKGGWWWRGGEGDGAISSRDE